MNETPLISVEDLSVDFRSGEQGHACRQARVVRHRPRRDGGSGRRVRLGQDGDGAVDPQAPPLPFRVASFGEDPVQRREPAVAAAGRLAQDQGQQDLHDLPGADDLAQPAAHHREPGRRGVEDPSRAVGPGGARARARSAEEGGHRRSGRAAQILSASALGRAAAESDDRHGARQRARPADRRRADHRARRDDPGADPRPAAQAQGRVQHGHAADHPRSRHRAQDGRPGLRHEQRRDRRTGRDACSCSPRRSMPIPSI